MVLKILILGTTRREGLETENLKIVKAGITFTFPLINVVAFKPVNFRFSQQLWV